MKNKKSKQEPKNAKEKAFVAEGKNPNGKIALEKYHKKRGQDLIDALSDSKGNIISGCCDILLFGFSLSDNPSYRKTNAHTSPWYVNSEGVFTNR